MKKKEMKNEEARRGIRLQPKSKSPRPHIWSRSEKSALLLAFLTKCWKYKLTGSERDEWEAYGGAMKKKLRGHMAFIQSNIFAATAGFSIPRTKPPMGDPLPPPPCNFNGFFDDKRREVVLTFQKPYLVAPFSDVAVVIYLSRGRNKFHPQIYIIGCIPIRSSLGDPEEKNYNERYSYRFSEFPPDLKIWGKYRAKFGGRDRSLVFQLATICALGPQRGAIRGSFSASQVIRIPPPPPQRQEKEQIFLLEKNIRRIYPKVNPKFLNFHNF